MFCDHCRKRICLLLFGNESCTFPSQLLTTPFMKSTRVPLGFFSNSQKLFIVALLLYISDLKFPCALHAKLWQHRYNSTNTKKKKKPVTVLCDFNASIHLLISMLPMPLCDICLVPFCRAPYMLIIGKLICYSHGSRAQQPFIYVSM